MITYDRLSQIIPADQALANKALSMALSQITGIKQLKLPAFGAVVKSIRTNKDLPDINALTTAVPPAVADYYTSNLGQGTGPNNTVLIVDLLGTAAGWTHTQALTNTLEQFSTMNLSALTNVYTTMLDVVNGIYGDPVAGPVVIPSGPYAGTYTDANDAFTNALIPGAQTEISNLISSYPDQTATLNTDWTAMANQLSNEKTLQNKATLVFADLLANAQSSIYGLIFSLPSYGLQTEQGGMAQFFELLADLSTQSGQAIVAVLRQGINQQILNNAGIYTNSNIPAEPVTEPPQANLIPSVYSESEAQNLVIK